MSRQAVQIQARGIDLEVELDAYAGTSATIDRYGKPTSEDDPADMELLHVFVGIKEGETEIDVLDLLVDAPVLEEIKGKCWLVLNEPDVDTSSVDGY